MGILVVTLPLVAAMLVQGHIAQNLDRLANEASLADKIKSIEESVTNLAKYGKLNLIFTNGKLLFIHTNCPKTMYEFSSTRSKLFCTKPLFKGEWTPVPLNRLLVFQSGNQIYEGIEHDYEYLKVNDTLKFERWS